MKNKSSFERVNYFEGQLLSASDFQAEQEYFLARLRRHNRYLHGVGVVCGLKVSTASSSEIIVQPGVAIDCYGNEIHVPTPTRVSIPHLPGEQFVVLKYSEEEVAPVPIASATSDKDSEGRAFTRIREGFQIEILSANPAPGHRDKGCGRLHPICLAKIRKSRRSWKVTACGRRPALRRRRL
jgi:hypothetical protein